MISLNAHTQNKYILLNNLSKPSLLMKFGQNFTKTVTQNLVPGPFVFAKN